MAIDLQTVARAELGMKAAKANTRYWERELKRAMAPNARNRMAARRALPVAVEWMTKLQNCPRGG